MGQEQTAEEAEVRRQRWEQAREEQGEGRREVGWREGWENMRLWAEVGRARVLHREVSMESMPWIQYTATTV